MHRAESPSFIFILQSPIVLEMRDAKYSPRPFQGHPPLGGGMYENLSALSESRQMVQNPLSRKIE